MVTQKIKDLVPEPLVPVAKLCWDTAQHLLPRKNRSLFHGVLFDLKGGDYSTEGMTFKIDRGQFPLSFRSRLYFDIYEAAERKLAHKWISPQACVLELGGCIGVLSCVINSMLADKSSHVVVEANPSLISLLEENRTVNGCEFHVENCIVSREERSDFYISRLMTANRADSGNGRKISVRTKTVEELEAMIGKQFDTLVMDIEGGELSFLQENQSFLERVNLVMLELHRKILSHEELANCETILNQAGLDRIETIDETEVWIRPA